MRWCNCTDISTCEHFALLELVGFERQLVNWLTSVLFDLCPCSTAGSGAQTSRRPLLSTSKSSYIHFMLAFLTILLLLLSLPVSYFYHYNYYYYYYYDWFCFHILLLSSLSHQLGLQYFIYFVIIIIIIILLLISISRPLKYVQWQPNGTKFENVKNFILSDDDVEFDSHILVAWDCSWIFLLGFINCLLSSSLW